MRYLKMARVWAENSYCVRRQVGALVVKDKMIISDGYNGTPSGFENVCEDENNVTKPYVLHAEANAITKLARSNNNSDGATISTIAMAPPSISRLHPVSSVPSSSSRPASVGWSMANSIVSPMASTCCAGQVSRWSLWISILPNNSNSWLIIDIYVLHRFGWPSVWSSVS